MTNDFLQTAKAYGGVISAFGLLSAGMIQLMEKFLVGIELNSFQKPRLHIEKRLSGLLINACSARS